MKLKSALLLSFVMFVGLGLANDARAQARVLLGDRHVSDMTETDTIQVGVKRGAFRGLQVKVTGAPVEFKRVTVHFENGDEQVFEQNRIVRGGGRTRVIDLEGGARIIDRVVFRYEARTRGWKGADIKLWGVR